MARWLGLALDPTRGGTTYDDITADVDPVEIPDPTIWVPATTAQASPGSNNLDRNNEVTGSRGNPPPVSFSADPSVTFESRAYPAIVKPIISRALSSIGTPSGTRPAAITTEINPTDSNPLAALVVHLLREEQYDVLTGVAVGSFSLNLPVDAEGTISLGDGRALYHDVPQTLPDPLPTPSYTATGGRQTYMLRDVSAFLGDGAGVRIDCLAGFRLDYNNSLIGDFQSRYCAGENIRIVRVGGVDYRIWLPGRNKIGPQRITGTLDFGVTRPDLELARMIAQAQKLVVECTAGPAGTTPAADEMMRITLHKQVFMDGGAGDLVKDGDIRSSYQFEAFLDPATGRDLTVEFVSSAAVA